MENEKIAELALSIVGTKAAVEAFRDLISISDPEQRKQIADAVIAKFVEKDSWELRDAVKGKVAEFASEVAAKLIEEKKGEIEKEIRQRFDETLPNAVRQTVDMVLDQAKRDIFHMAIDRIRR